jgi:hypothetical protein
MVKIWKKCSEEKQRHTPISSVDGKVIGFLSTSDAIAISCAGSNHCADVLDSVTYSDGSTIQRHFSLVFWKKELFQVGWDGDRIEMLTRGTISVATRESFGEMLARYNRDSRWTRA